MGDKLSRRSVLIAFTAIFLPAMIGLERYFFNILRPYGEPNTNNPIPHPTKKHEPLSKHSTKVVLVSGFQNRFTPIKYGQGILIGDRYILTAAHVALMFNFKKTVRLQYNTALGAPTLSMRAVKVHILQGFEGNNTPDKDLGLIEIEPIEQDVSITLSEFTAHDLALPIRILAFWGRGWWHFRDFEQQYSSVGKRLRTPITESRTHGRHDARTLGMWSGAPVFAYISKDRWDLIGIHGNYLRGVANLFCGFDKQLKNEITNLENGIMPNQKIWRNTWARPNYIS